MSGDVFSRIRETIGQKPAETGGALGGSRQTGEVTHFWFDAEADDQGASFYTPNAAVLNRVIKQHWNPLGIDYLGSIHSHPAHAPLPSEGDGVYARSILDTLGGGRLFSLICAIVMTIPDSGAFSVAPFQALPVGQSGVLFVPQQLLVAGELPEGGGAGAKRKSISI